MGQPIRLRCCCERNPKPRAQAFIRPSTNAACLISVSTVVASDPLSTHGDLLLSCVWRAAQYSRHTDDPMNPLLILLLIACPLISQAVASTLRKRFVKYSADPMPLSGAETAKRMLAESNIHDVQVVPTRGELTDHYDPKTKTVALSEVVYSRANVAACAVAAHECGHAIQHATGYPFLGMRSAMVPLLRLSNAALPVISIGGAFLSGQSGNSTIAFAFLGLLALPALFSIVTLPVEFNASRRALNWMDSSQVAAGANYSGAKTALWWAAMTYVVAALGSIAQVLIYAQRFLGRRR